MKQIKRIGYLSMGFFPLLLFGYMFFLPLFRFGVVVAGFVLPISNFGIAGVTAFIFMFAASYFGRRLSERISKNVLNG